LLADEKKERKKGKRRLKKGGRGEERKEKGCPAQLWLAFGVRIC